MSTACQQVCPTQAITFGDLNDKGSKVAKLQALQRNYGLLDDLNTRPRTTYLGYVRNPNEALRRRACAVPNPDRNTGSGDRRSRIPDRDISGAGTRLYDGQPDRIAGVVYLPWKQSPKKWLVGAFISFCFVNVLMLAVCYLFLRGVGIWGINIPVAWGFAIINFVWWIGIGHAGTLISAILFLLKQDWRTSINRFSEAMTLFAVACAGMFPILHLGRPWLAYWLLPYPNSMWLWPQPRSPLEWDVFAVSTYGMTSLVFWYVGSDSRFGHHARHRAASVAAADLRLLALGWRGSAIHWHRYQKAYLLLAGLATPLVLSVHTIVCFDFAVASCPAGTPRFSRPTSSPAPCTRDLPWC